MAFLQLPAELLFSITDYIWDVSDLNALSQVNRRMNTTVTPLLYRRAMLLLLEEMTWYAADTLSLQIEKKKCWKGDSNANRGSTVCRRRRSPFLVRMSPLLVRMLSS
jgi:hypothetical protein